MRPTHLAHGALLLLTSAVVACSDATSPDGGAAASPPIVAGTPGGHAVMPDVGTAADPLRLTGGGFLTEWTFTSSQGTTHGWATTVLASTGSLVEDGGKCCRILGDTVLQINYGGTPEVGARAMQAPEVKIGGGDFRHYGPDDALLMIRDGDNRMRFFLPVKAWALEITSYVAPTETSPGEVRGRAAFEAMVLVQERADVLEPYLMRKIDGTTTVRAEFVTPLRYQVRSMSAPF